MKNPLISVIIPVYGVENYISECLESVMKQTYKNLEIIVINDGTKDNSANIAKEYSKIDSRISVYDYPNGGISVARNRGIMHSKGDYIAFLDSDDCVDECMYEKLLQAAITYDADYVKCGFLEFHINKLKGKKFILSNSVIRNNDCNLLKFYFKGILWTTVWNALYSRDLASKVVFPVNVVYEDNYTSGMYLALCKKIVTLNYCGYFYRKNMRGISKGGIKRPLDKILAINKLKYDLNKKIYTCEKIDWKLCVEFYHFILGLNKNYRVKAIKKSLYSYIYNNLDIRRKLVFLYFIKKNKIVIYRKD